MSFQAYLDAIEDKTGKTPRALVAEAKDRGFEGPAVKANDVVAWLKAEYGLGRGHAMALVHVIKNGAKIDSKHIGSTGTHRDDSDTPVAGRQGQQADGKADVASGRPRARLS